MTHADYRGARGSNTGDDYHVLWALRHALSLLEPETTLSAITVEGLRAEDESGTPQDAWDGVDCALYFGGDRAISADRVVIDQLKYSAANPHQAWTVARLTHSTASRKNNSVFAKLANAFRQVKNIAPNLVTNHNLTIRLVSNQPIHSEVITVITIQDTTDNDYKVLQASSGLSALDFNDFLQCLDFSECGTQSRFAFEERVLATISDWTDDDARSIINDLMRHISRAMLPESKGEYITRQSMLSWHGFSDAGALFPCPSAIKKLGNPIPRAAAQDVVQQMRNGTQRICLHGEGGCGKTTILQEVDAFLPTDSVMIVFDCYGGGRYLDADAYRHRPQDAFLQLSNDLSSSLRIPFLLTKSPSADYPRSFKKRLSKAAQVVASKAKDALLVIVVDAADNSVTAAEMRGEKSFIHDFTNLGELPENVRFIVSSRTGRLGLLDLPQSFTPLRIMGFERHETSVHVRQIYTDAPDAWIDDFHHLSSGNPRVQFYALDYAQNDPAQALNYLRPNGKSLDQVFREKLQQTELRVGRAQDVKQFCSGLTSLPRPIPVGYIAAVIGLHEDHIRDMCNDLAPGIRLINDLIGFADEDFEHFIGVLAQEQHRIIQVKTAEYLLSRHKQDAYAAIHVATALFNAGQRKAIIDLVSTESEPQAISDPILRREIQLQRLRLAMRVCRETGNNVDALLTLLIGAEALKTDVTIRRMLIENPELAVNFARDSASKSILRNAEEIEHHGPLLFHQMAADARKGNGIAVREGHRQVAEWMKRRNDAFEQQKQKFPNSQPHGWSIDDRDITAEIEAILRIQGPSEAFKYLSSWTPKTLAVHVALLISSRLLRAGETHLVQKCIEETNIPTSWKLFLLTPLALAGEQIDLTLLESSLASLFRRRLIHLDMLEDDWVDHGRSARYLEIVLTACEVVVARGGDRKHIIPLLEQIAAPESRYYDRLYTSQTSLVDLSLRAHMLLEYLAGRKPSLSSYLVDPPEPSSEASSHEKENFRKTNDNKKEELQNFIGPLITLYDVRTQVLLGLIQPDETEKLFRQAIAHYQGQSYKFERQISSSRMSVKAACSLSRLIALPELDHLSLLSCVLAFLGENSESSRSNDLQVFANFALDSSLHSPILSIIAKRAENIKRMKASADDKIEALTSYSRLLLPISYDDAEALFKDAVDIASGVNNEAVFEVSVFAPFAQCAVTIMTMEQRQSVAANLAIIASDTSICLGRSDSFPWQKVGQALTTLDINLALAAVARWDDEGIVEYSTLLPFILQSAISSRAMSITQVSALLAFLDHDSSELLNCIVTAAGNYDGNGYRSMVAEHLAREELLRFGKGLRPEVSRMLSALLGKEKAGFWVNRLAQTTAFHAQERPERVTASDNQGYPPIEKKANKERVDPLTYIDWARERFISAESVLATIRTVTKVADESGGFVPITSILDRMMEAVRVGDRVQHLIALANSSSSLITEYALADAITNRVKEWSQTPSVSRWARDHLMGVLVKRLPGFVLGLAYDLPPFLSLIKKTQLPDAQICSSLLDAMEQHVDGLSASTIYSLVGLIGQFSAPVDAMQVMTRYADRLVRRIPTNEQDIWEPNNIPISITGGIARFLYAYLGDIDVRKRWRAAHALRSYANLGESEVIDNILRLYSQISETVYRAPSAPFYWLAARLWLMIALDKIADENPLSVRCHGLWLLDAATNSEFPHILIRAFAKSALQKLTTNHHVILDDSQTNTLRQVNISSMPRQQRNQCHHSASFEKYGDQGREDRRFHFDSMDTLPYWYSRALEVFADVTNNEFLDEAEHWIVDRWNVQNNPWRWDDEPRKYRLSKRTYVSVDHRHGSLPTLERYSTHLEWHAMWCATGKLMQTHALVIGEDDNYYYSFESWLLSNGLTIPPLWLADLHGPKPLEERFWYAPDQDIALWLAAISEDDFRAEAGLASHQSAIVVGCSHETRSPDFKLSSHVRTALVSPDTAGALMRAFQAVDDFWYCNMPSAGDESEINSPPYTLLGWLTHRDRDLKIDKIDPLRYGISGVECEPANMVIKSLDLVFAHDLQVTWKDADSGSQVFFYESWSDSRDDEREEDFRYDKKVRSSGWRLWIDTESLRHFLNDTGYDLLMQIGVTKGNRGNYDYSSYDQEKNKESQFARVLLFRKDGAFESTKGYLGTWAASC